MILKLQTQILSSKNLILLDVDIQKIQVPSMVSSGEKIYVQNVGYLSFKREVR